MKYIFFCIVHDDSIEKVYKCSEGIHFQHEIPEIRFIDGLVLEQYKVQHKLEEALVITDDSKIVEKCFHWNIACGVILHKKNKEQHFPMGIYCMEGIEGIDEDYLLKMYQRAKKIPWTILETERLVLREITVEDVPRLYELYADPSITKYMEDLFSTQEEEIEYTKEYIKNVYEFYGYGIWVIVLKETNEVIGRAGVESKDSMEGLELGFMLGVDYQHKGYALEICKAIIQYAKTELEEENIRAMVQPGNVASKNLCEKLGMHTDQILYDGHYMYRYS